MLRAGQQELTPQRRRADTALQAENRRLRSRLLTFSLLMFAFGFALAPVFMHFAGLRGATELFRGDEPAFSASRVDLLRSVSILFDTNTQRLDWSFRPVEGRIGVHPGELRQVVYELRNNLDRPVTAQAVPGYEPGEAARYFKRLQCFCFQPQTLAPHEVRRVPVVFVIDPDLPQGLDRVTLSYTFFEVGGAQPLEPAESWPAPRPRWAGLDFESGGADYGARAGRGAS
jgi:cytochrome c oxidase assembly protein subunit 11